jgi:hypothetical protein
MSNTQFPAQGVHASQHNPNSHPGTGPPGTPIAPNPTANIHGLTLDAAQTTALNQIIADLLEQHTGALNSTIGQLQAQITDLQTRQDSLLKQLNDFTSTEKFDGVLNTMPTIRLLQERTQSLLALASHTPAPSQHSLVSPPEEFTGDRARFRAWQSQLRLYISMNSSRLSTDRQQVLYAISTIRGEAYSYVQAIADSDDHPIPAPELLSFKAFMRTMETIFGPVDLAGDAQRELRDLRQKKTQSVEQYSTEFRKWSGLTGYDKKALMSMYNNGLQSHIRNLLIHASEPETLEDSMRQAATMDSKHRTANSTRTASQATGTHALPAPSISTPADPNAMDICRMRLDEMKKKLPKEERERREKDGLCMNCGKSKHRALDCRSPFSVIKPPAWRQRIASMPMIPSAAPQPSSSATLTNETVNQLIEALKATVAKAPAVPKAEEPAAGSAPGF